MTDIQFEQIGNFPVVRDLPAWKLPQDIFTEVLNVRLRNSRVERMPGDKTIFGTLPVVPAHVRYVPTNEDNYWVILGLTEAHVWTGSSFTEITNSGGDYAAPTFHAWNSCVLGGVPIFNNGVDVPQQWGLSPGSPMTDLSNWPAGVTAKVLRTFGPYLVALNIVESGTKYPHMVWWSHPAVPGTVPSSWDYTDPTVDAGRFDLSNVLGGTIVDGLELQNQFILYKENSTHLMRVVGGDLIFAQQPFLQSSGLLAQGCVTQFMKGSSHFVVTGDDILVHNGQKADSIIESKLRSSLFQEIDTERVDQCFCFELTREKEVWFVYPEKGNEENSKALIYNYAHNTIYFADCNYRFADVGNLELATSETWDSDTGAWNSDTSAWNESSFRTGVAVDATQALDIGTSSATKNASFGRTGLGSIKVSDRKLLAGLEDEKLVTRVWLRTEGSGRLACRLGVQENEQSAVEWSGLQVFTPGDDLYLDFDDVSGRFIAYRFESVDGDLFTLGGFTLDITNIGRL